MGIDGDYSDGCAYVRGGYVPIGDATISLLDAGFARSDVTYDVVGVWDGAFFRLDDHLDRFERSCKELHLDIGVNRGELTQILHECVRRSGLREAYVDMIATRGMPRGSRDPRTYENSFYAYAIPYVWIVQPDDQVVGSDLVIARQTVRIPETSVDPTVKNFHWGDMVRGMFEAYERGGTVVALPDSEGNVTEGPGFNVFALVDGELVSPSSGVLEGVTRRTVLDLADDMGVSARLGVLPAETLGAADEVFLTSTDGGVMPVVTVDGTPVGDGRPGELTLRLRQAYWDAHADPRWATPISY
ncbi:MAG: aminotransferase class IV [Actinomycetota bacterium]|nr:aminotransferase class IV [Actinomycetota bacterium]